MFTGLRNEAKILIWGVHECEFAPRVLGPDVVDAICRVVLENVPVSSFIAGLLASPEPSVLAAALQLAQLLMEKLPDIFCRWALTLIT